MLKISVVTISYNQGDYLKRCLDSVLSQDYPALQYIVVDPGSSDSSRALIDACGDRVERIYEPDRGPADGLNRGFAQATGDIYHFLNADDALLPGSLAYAASVFQANPRIDVLCGSGMKVDGDGRALREIRASPLSLLRLAYGAVNFFQQGMFFRAGSFRQVNGFNVDNRTCWDGELILDMALQGARFRSTRRQLALFRIHDASISGTGRLVETYRQDGERLFRKAMHRERRLYDCIPAGMFLLEKHLLTRLPSRWR